MTWAVHTTVSVDLDDVGCYHAIHGLPPPDDASAGLVLRRCLPRFLSVFAECGVKATFFVIGRDLARDLETGGEGAALLKEAVAAGHELGNHSFAHDYRMTRWGVAEQRADVQRCDAQLRALGVEPQGFRAPGYTHDAQLMRVVAELGYRYDSSALPSPPYYAAKLMAMGAMRVIGRHSQSLATGAGSFFGPRGIHRREDAPLWEIPISVAGVAGWPLIGTTVLGQPGYIVAPLRRKARKLKFLNLELHGLDLACPDRDGFAPALRKVQPELRSPLHLRRARLQELLVLRGGGWRLRDAVPGG